MSANEIAFFVLWLTSLGIVSYWAGYGIGVGQSLDERRKSEKKEREEREYRIR